MLNIAHLYVRDYLFHVSLNCWWFRNPNKQPPFGCINLVKSWDFQLPTSTGAFPPDFWLPSTVWNDAARPNNCMHYNTMVKYKSWSLDHVGHVARGVVRDQTKRICKKKQPRVDFKKKREECCSKKYAIFFTLTKHHCGILRHLALNWYVLLCRRLVLHHNVFAVIFGHR